eukprot:CAMPEP_0172308096 /NCGR_PEP_ID=MMETSP1058-20130122/8802_1 /TAXON_ID=83371 /ORGANISM="Detonula confervacea, Strain CCMP 353" /LENGTH=592 /DNA_ID=CAMNT_0013020449 /DNA_START=20 /DNA_END=1798 /DNA_ORIENTATION=-
MAATGPSSPDTTKETPAAAGTKTVDSAVNHAVASQCAVTSSATTATATQPAASATTAAITMPTYLSAKQSKAYTLSKQLLSSGSLDDALTTLEMALQLSREMLANTISAVASANEDDDDDDVNIELHESLAPLYYLYGTTLLYSVEESDVMMANGKQQQQGGAIPEDVEVEVPSAENEADEPQNEANDHNDDDNGDDDHDHAAVDSTEDLQIAWENLDLARSIISRLVDTFHNNIDSSDDNAIVVLKSNTKTNDASSTINHNYTPAQQTELLLDLAQIHTRLGDLQRANANVLPCIDDYNLALKLRLSCRGKFDKKVADSHFSLAAVYAEAPNRVDENEGKVDQFVNSLGAGVGGGGGECEKRELSEEEKGEFRHLSLEHYLACGMAFAGLLAKMCGEDADEFLMNVGTENTGSASASAAMSSAAASSSSNCNHHSKTMATLRQRLTLLPPPTSQADNDEFNDLTEMLDEIQEAIDSAEETEEGLKSLGEMKANEIKKHEMKNSGGDGETNKLEEGVTTTIGFGAPSGSSSFAGIGATSSSSVNAFGSTMSAEALSATATASAPTMMIVKKKKKKQKPQSLEEESAKRLKTN